MKLKRHVKALAIHLIVCTVGQGMMHNILLAIVPSAMIFVPSVNGKSHCEEELTTYEDCAKGADILLETVLTLQAKFSMGETST